MADKKVGQVVHYYDKLGVAVISLTDGSLAVGDMIKISCGDEEFTQTVESMQVEHKEVKSAAKGDEFGLKVDQPVKNKAVVYKE
ncbi:hypothetical protein KKD62_01625 [Patescibacteria group bacterium]|nr:hypothetical protein [Patescibacteria group bacterium]MBU1931777.1 hypothetical protein [Patescibacteria group bacterium]